ncbi:unnamed protein product [Chrysoparadoxa australica]
MRLTSSAGCTVAAALLLQLGRPAQGHPLCLDQAFPTPQQLDFCNYVNDNPDGSCCDQKRDAELRQRFLEETEGLVLSQECLDHHAQNLCGECQPWAEHLFGAIRQNNGKYMPDDPKYIQGGEMFLCKEFCNTYENSCPFALGYCQDHAAPAQQDDPGYCYPFVSDYDPTQTDLAPHFTNIPTETFPLPMVGMYRHPLKNKWWVIELLGRIIQFDMDPASQEMETVFDITDRVFAKTWSEGGLAGFAFSPGFANNCHAYVGYFNFEEQGEFGDCPGCPDEFIQKTNGKYVGTSIISRFTFGTPQGGCDNFSNAQILETEIKLMETDQATEEHNCGAWLGFRPDEDPWAETHDLYISCGDGGPQNDPFIVSQDTFDPLGSLLRVEVSTYETLIPDAAGRLYGLPEDNPFMPGQQYAGLGLEEAYSWGFRNPWKCSWDSKPPHAMFCSDSSQDRIDLIKRVRKGDNFGWGAWEGSHCNIELINPATGKPQCEEIPFESITMPIVTACHNWWRNNPPDIEVPNRDRECPLFPGSPTANLYEASSFIGGFVYHGERYKDVLEGWYIYSDWGKQQLMAAHPPPSGNDNDPWVVTVIATKDDDNFPKTSAFAQDDDGEIYIVGYTNSYDNRAAIYDLPCGEICADTGGRSADAYTYKGCYYDRRNNDPEMTGDVQWFGNLTPEVCAQHCAGVGFNYFGLQGNRCSCGNTFGRDGRRANECSDPCEGDGSYMCGGPQANSVYQVAAPEPYPNTGNVFYRGCYKDNFDAMEQSPDGWEYIPLYQHLVTGSFLVQDDMTLGVCTQHCLGQGFALLALTKGNECLCGYEGEDFGYFGESSLCTMACPGEPGAARGCGGAYSASVYEVAPGGQAKEEEDGGYMYGKEEPLIEEEEEEEPVAEEEDSGYVHGNEEPLIDNEPNLILDPDAWWKDDPLNAAPEPESEPKQPDPVPAQPVPVPEQLPVPVPVLKPEPIAEEEDDIWGVEKEEEEQKRGAGRRPEGSRPQRGGGEEERDSSNLRGEVAPDGGVEVEGRERSNQGALGSGEASSKGGGMSAKKRKGIIAAVTSFTAVVLLAASVFLYKRSRRKY